jgi:YD repeat-containing protein
MKDLRVEITDAGTGLYLAVDPDGVWAKTTRPDELITVDWDAQGRVIGIEVIGDPARNAVIALAQSIADYPIVDDKEAVLQAVASLLPPEDLGGASPHEAQAEPPDQLRADSPQEARADAVSP